MALEAGRELAGYRLVEQIGDAQVDTTPLEAFTAVGHECRRRRDEGDAHGCPPAVARSDTIPADR